MGVMEKSEKILKEVLESNPVRRGFILECGDDITRFLSGETDEIRQLTCRLGYKIQELFELGDTEVVPLGVDPTTGELSWVLVRILEVQTDGQKDGPSL
jgi:hypothetical protein